MIRALSDRRYQGILLGTNDTVYLAIAGAGTGTQLNIAAWAGPSGPADFDIYARCGSLPTPTVWQARSNHGGNEEFLTISNAQCGPASVLYVAVNSFNGSGGFNIMASRMNTTANKSL